MSAAEDAMAARLKIVQPWERSRRNGNVAVPAGLTASPNLTDVDIHGFWKDHAEISYGPITDFLRWKIGRRGILTRGRADEYDQW